MSRLRTTILITSAVLVMEGAAFAQLQGTVANVQAEVLHQMTLQIPREFPIRGRELVVEQGHFELEAGIDINFTGEAFGIPLGGAYGLIEHLELGAELLMMFAPFRAGNAFVSNFALYGRYELTPNQLAGELTLRVPGALGDFEHLDLDVDVPFLLELNESMRLYLQGSARTVFASHFGFSLGVAASFVYLINPQIYANVATQIVLGLAPDVAAPIGDTGLPLLIGGGYMLGPQNGIGVSLQTTDLVHGTRSWGISATYVQPF